MRVKRVIFVKANWCPHCRASVPYIRKIAEELKAEVLELDIDNRHEEKLADEIVKKHGDWSADYIIPQVFLEFQNGTIEHILTGNPKGVDYTIAAWNEFLNSDYYKTLKLSSS